MNVCIVHEVGTWWRWKHIWSGNGKTEKKDTIWRGRCK